MRLRLSVVMVMALLVVAPAAQAATGTDERSAPVTVLLVGIGAVVGVVVGLVPALVVAILLGYLPPPRLAGRRGGVLVEPARAELPSAVRAPLVAPGPVARAAPPAPAPAPAAPQPLQPPALGVLAQARHQSVYDAAYAEQAERVEALRSAIGGRLRKRPTPPGE